MSLVMFADPAQGSIQVCGVWLLALQSYQEQPAILSEESRPVVSQRAPQPGFVWWFPCDWEGHSASPSGTICPV